MVVTRARGRATTRAETAGGVWEGRRKGEARGNGACVAEAAAKEEEGAVPRPLEEEG